MTSRQRGFAALEAVLVGVIVIALGLVVYRVYTTTQTANVKATTATAPKAAATNTPSNDGYQSKSDLTAAETQMDTQDLDSSTPDEAALDAALTSF